MEPHERKAWEEEQWNKWVTCESCGQPMNEDNPCVNDDDITCQSCMEDDMDHALEEHKYRFNK